MAFIPTLNISADGVPDYKDYYHQIEDRAVDGTERLNLINQLLLNEKQQPFMYQALLHTYKIENETYKQVWKTLMSKGYASIDQVISECNLDLTTGDFNWVMVRAAGGGHKEIVEMMIAQGANDFNRSIVYAAEGGHKDIVELLIAHGAIDFNRAMAHAASEGHKEIVEMMIARGANDFDEAMREAARGGHKDIVDLLQPYMN